MGPGDGRVTSVTLRDAGAAYHGSIPSRGDADACLDL